MQQNTTASLPIHHYRHKTYLCLRWGSSIRLFERTFNEEQQRTVPLRTVGKQKVTTGTLLSVLPFLASRPVT